MTKNERVKELRNELRLSQAAFGKEIGVSQRQVAHIELGGKIIERNFESICRNFNVNPQWLIDLPRPAREAVINWTFNMVIQIEAQASNKKKENGIAELEKLIAEQQKNGLSSRDKPTLMLKIRQLVLLEILSLPQKLIFLEKINKIKSPSAEGFTF